jgi:TonB family protein
MKNALPLASIFAACLTLGAQDDANIKLPKDPKVILEMAAPFYDYSLASPAWRLSYHYRLLDDQGKMSAEGEFEYWWSAPGVSRISWTKGSNVHDEWHTAEGKLLQLVKGEDITSMEHRLSSAILISLPKTQDYQSGRTSLKLVELDNSGISNLCVAVVSAGAVPTGSMPLTSSQPGGLQGVGTAYCFDSEAPVLVSTLQNHTITNSYSRIQKFLDHNIAGHIDISYLGTKKLEADLEESTEIKADDAAFNPAPDAVTPPIQMISRKIPITTGPGGGLAATVKPGMLISRVPPVYPPAARAARISGTVVVQAMIGKDGRIYNTQVVSSLDDSLSQAAIEAVRQWRYLPYTLNGAPVPVKTTINVEFTLDR